MPYSTAPTAPVVVAVIVVVPALQAIVPAVAETVNGQPAITVILDWEVLSAGASPFKVPKPEHTAVPGPNCNVLPMVDGPPRLFPIILIIAVLVTPAGITSVPLQIVITFPVLATIIQPAGNPVCNPFAAAAAIAIGILMLGLTLFACIGLAPVLVTLTLKSIIEP